MEKKYKRFPKCIFLIINKCGVHMYSALSRQNSLVTKYLKITQIGYGATVNILQFSKSCHTFLERFS